MSAPWPALPMLGSDYKRVSSYFLYSASELAFEESL